jgi:hypothetical protein
VPLAINPSFFKLPMVKFFNMLFMGLGKSSSKWNEISWKDEGDSFCRWTGVVVTDGGGFCGTVYDKEIELSSLTSDGIQLRVRGDGNRYKLRLKPGKDNQGSPTYQTAFDTKKDQWMDIKLPYDSFVPLSDKIKVDYNAPKLSSLLTEKKSWSLGLLFSRFEFNDTPNPYFPSMAEVSFALDVDDIVAYKNVRPKLILISSAGTERNNRLSSDEARARDIPIIQLNPQVLHC